jgi:transposase-like protein
MAHLPSPLRRAIKLMKLHCLVTGSYAPVPTLNTERLTPVNIFMQLSCGLLSGQKYRIPCTQCGSIRVIKYGFDCSKQTYYCKDCKHKFRQPSLVRKSKYTPELITLTLDLYFSGLSLRKIARSVNDHFGVEVNYSTIYDWIQKYIPLISDYVNALTPQLSETWHADELFVRMKGSPPSGTIQRLGILMERDGQGNKVPASIQSIRE